MIIRAAEQSDLPEILTIYNDVIATSTAVYTGQPVTLEDRLLWMQSRLAQGFPVIVAIEESEVHGFASFGEWRGAWPGYRHTVEHSVHVRAGCRGKGVGQALMKSMFPLALNLGKHVMLGGIDVSNSESIRFHERLGFERVAHFREVGRKFDRWLDLIFMQRFMDSPGTEPHT
jgi:L-amino acid N-acyltransferase